MIQIAKHPVVFHIIVATMLLVVFAYVGASRVGWLDIRKLSTYLLPVYPVKTAVILVAVFSLLPTLKLGREGYRKATGHYAWQKKKKSFQRMLAEDPNKALREHSPQEIAKLMGLPRRSAAKLHDRAILNHRICMASLATGIGAVLAASIWFARKHM